MINIGILQKLRVIKFTDFGAYLGDDEILLPNRYIPENLQIGDELEVFVYTDSEDRPIATTLKPKASLGDIAVLEVVDVVRNGCYLDLGIAKDIFMPTKVSKNYKIGQKVAVKINLDRQNRLVARLGIKEHLKPAPNFFKEGERKKAFVFEESDLGFGCVVERENYGLLYKNETFENISIGDEKEVSIKKVRDDGKLDLTLKKIGDNQAKDDVQKVLDCLKKSGGELKLHYDSDPQEIKEILGVSKKAFKRAISELLKDKKIELEVGVRIFCFSLQN